MKEVRKHILEDILLVFCQGLLQEVLSDSHLIALISWSDFNLMNHELKRA